MTNKYEQRKEEILARIDINDYIRRYAWVLFKQKQKPIIRSRSDADYYKQLFSNPVHSPLRSILGISSGELYKYCQDVEYVPSNLGVGFLFYFICVWCERRVRYLYVDQNLEALLCRKCSHFPYRQASRLERKISRYARRYPERAQQIINAFIDEWPKPT